MAEKDSGVTSDRPFMLRILPGCPATKADRFSPRWGYAGTVRRKLKKMTPEIWAEIQKRSGPRKIEGYLFEGIQLTTND